jgi:uncharacterized repeat protein (TIGR03803 family)
MNILKTLRLPLSGLLLLACVAAVRGQSISLSVLHQFGSVNNDGSSPYSEVIRGADGILYGTTWGGGSNAAGTVFRMNANGGGFALLHQFKNIDDGSTPFAGVLQASDGFLYGTTYYGGTNANGTIFKVSTNGLSYSIIHQFTNSPDGANPYGALIQGGDGALYGTTRSGGSGTQGTVFKINTNGTQYTVLHSFTSFPDGTFPYGQLVQASNGMLYGTTYSGGANLLGTVFQINTNGSNYSVLRSFGGATGGFSLQCGLLLGKDGWLYGTTIVGGDAGYGTIFKMNTNGSGFAVLRNFTNSPDGANSYARLAQGNDGFLYGVTSSGGYTNTGTIFRVNTNGANYSVLYRFTGEADGEQPMAGLFTTGNGVFYGTTLMGGAAFASLGTVYRLALMPVLSLTLSNQTAPLLTLNGAAGQACQVQASSNLFDWSVLANLSLTNGSAQLLDATWTNSPARFYRALIP